MKTLLLATLFVSSSAFAAVPSSLSGTFHNAADCTLNESLTIPAGAIHVRENIPVKLEDGEARSIILQAGDSVHAILTLSEGEHREFSYGPTAFTLGAYTENGFEQTSGRGLLENYDSKIVIQKSGRGLLLSATSAEGTATCQLN